MENETNFFYNVPEYDITTNSYIMNNNQNNNNSNNTNNNSNSNYYSSTVPPSPSTQMSGSGDGGFSISAADFYTSDQDDLASVFLDLQKLAGIDNDHRGKSSSGGGDEVTKRARGRPRISGGTFGGTSDMKKDVVSADKLDELKAFDPKRAKRILANRQSAARSKERKARYLTELERRIQALQMETIELTAQLRIYQRDTSGLTTENAELKIRLQVMEQQAQLRDGLNEALKHEVDRLKIANGEMKTPTEIYNFNGSRNVPYSPIASPSTLNYSPQQSPSTSSPVLQNSSMLPLQKQSVPMLSPLPPLHNSRSNLSNLRFQGLNGFENIDNKGSSLPIAEGNSNTQMVTP